MKRLLLSLLIMSMLLCGCADTSVMSDSGEKNVSSETTPTITEEALASDAESVDTGTMDSTQEVSAGVSVSAISEETEPYELKIVYDLRNRPDGNEVSIFKDNTFDCDYSGYKKIEYGFTYLKWSLMIPEDWNSYRFYCDEPAIEQTLIGVPIYDGPIPADINYSKLSSLFAADPLYTAPFFLAESQWIDTANVLSGYTTFNGLLTKYDYETYTDKNGRLMKIYFLDGLPRLAIYEDFYSFCIVFNLKSEEQIPTVVNIINSIEVSLGWRGETFLRQAERLGYTIIPPEE